MSNQQKTKAKLDAQGGVGGAVGVDVMDSSQKASQQQGAVEGLQNEAEKIGGKIGQKAAEVLKNTAEQLAEGKLAGERGKIDGANANGGFAEESYKSGVISGAKLGTEYDSTKIIAGDKSTDGVAKFKHGSERIQQTRKDAIDNTLQKGVEETGMTPEEADKAMLAASLGLGGLGINHMLGNPAGKTWNKIDPLGKNSSKSFNGKSKNNGSNHQNNESNYAEKNKVSNHGNSSSDIKDYTKEFGQSKEAFERESRNLENLQHQRDSMVSQGKNTAVIDNKIEEASKKVDMHRENMNIADRNVKASKYLAGKTPVSAPESFTSKALKFGGKALVGADMGLSAYDAYNQFQAGNTTGGMFSSTQSATAAAFLAKPGPITGAAYAVSSAANLGYSAGGYAAKHTGGYTSVVDKFQSSSAPSYAKNAFSTPSGFNTMNAMGGGAYGNMMDAKNMGAALHKTDHAQATVDKLQDINIASDYQKEAVEEQAEVSREFMEQLINNNYNKGDL